MRLSQEFIQNLEVSAIFFIADIIIIALIFPLFSEHMNRRRNAPLRMLCAMRLIDAANVVMQAHWNTIETLHRLILDRDFYVKWGNRDVDPDQISRDFDSMLLHEEGSLVRTINFEHRVGFVSAGFTSNNISNVFELAELLYDLQPRLPVVVGIFLSGVEPSRLFDPSQWIEFQGRRAIPQNVYTLDARSLRPVVADDDAVIQYRSDTRIVIKLLEEFVRKSELPKKHLRDVLDQLDRLNSRAVILVRQIDSLRKWAVETCEILDIERYPVRRGEDGEPEQFAEISPKHDKQIREHKVINDKRYDNRQAMIELLSERRKIARASA